MPTQPATPSLLDGLPSDQPALAAAQAQSARAARVGFDWPNVADVLAKVDEELAELRAELPAAAPARLLHELGDLLQAVVNLARWLDLPAEQALHEANARFSTRFRHMEALATERGLRLEQLDPGELDALWREAKAATQVSG